MSVCCMSCYCTTIGTQLAYYLPTHISCFVPGPLTFLGGNRHTPAEDCCPVKGLLMRIGCFGACAVAFVFGCLTTRLAAQPPQPKLIVQITMDQLRGDLLRDYVPALSQGFRRLESGGFWIKHGDLNYAVTVSFPGHATLATGMYPYHHGLVANEFWTQRDGKWVSVDFSDDANFHILGDPAATGESPKFLLCQTLGEWVKQADPRAKAISLGSDENIPVAYAGHKSDGVYVFDPAANSFTTSTFYAARVADWVNTFNQTELPRYQQRSWNLVVARQFVSLASSQRTSLRGKPNPQFPHVYENEKASQPDHPQPYSAWFSSTPLKDEALFALAARAVDAERLGQRGAVDYLAIDVDSTDQVGHKFGPRSLEQLDTLVRLDHALARLLDHLDKVVGKNSYVVALSADHGAADPPELRAGGRRITTPEIEAVLDKIEAIAKANKGTPAELADRIAAELKQVDFIADAYTPARLSKQSDDPFVRLYQRSFRPSFTTDFPLWTTKPREYHPARYGVVVRFKEGMIFDWAVSVHGSPYEYDRDVPIIFYGANIRHGSQPDGVMTVDVAPTLGAAAGVRPPAGLDGHPLSFVFSTGVDGSQSTGK
jgi:predicted AlkP superfamily pyrophosphatase or phosphodiesterase